MALSTQIVRSSSPSLYSSTIPSSYDVFISFCGVDTRNGFVDHLYADFERKGLIVFKDDKKLERGKLINDELLEAIKQSQYAVVVISENFAFSKWCLIELDKIVECETERRLKVLPVFYRINPSEVRKQLEIFAQAFAKHKEDPNVGEQQRRAWSAALRKVGNIAGWHVLPTSAEATVVKEISRRIFCGVQSSSSKSFEGLVGIRSRVKELEKELCLGMDDVRFIGIHGMAGIGKTTLAKALFRKVCYEFDASCFICCGDNKRIWELHQQIVHETLGESNLKIWDPVRGMELLETRLRNKRIFITLDDVNSDQLEQLVGGANWFGQGSRIIVTSKDRQLLKPYVNKTYEVKLLDYGDAWELFCWKAFKNPHPKPSYQKLVENIMGLVKGHPLAIAIIGSSLYEKGEGVWSGVRDILEADSSGEIFNKLKISYEMLGDSLKKYFLDIACFGGWFVNILKLFDPSTSFYIEALEDKSLINTLRIEGVVMHDLLRKLGQQEVYQLSPLDPGKRSRLWVGRDIIQVLRNDSGTKAIEGMVMRGNPSDAIRIVMRGNPSDYYSKLKRWMEVKYESFSRMTRLTVLILEFDKFFYLKWIGDPSKLVLSNELRVIQWWGFPLKSLPISFQSDILVELHLQFSNIKVLWIGKKSFGQLKCIDLSFSKHLMEIPDLSGVPNLEKLRLHDCARLRKVHPAIANLTKLVLLDLYGCQRLGDNMTYLLHLVSRNNRIKSLPSSSLKSLSSLRELYLSGCTIGRPIDFERFFKTDPLYSHKQIGSLPHSICYLSWLTALTSLTDLGLGDCNLSDGDIPNDISCLSLLEYLNLSKNRFTRIPECIAQLSNLKYLFMRECKLLQSLSTSLPSCLSSLSYPLSDLETLATHKCHILQSSTTSLFLGLNSFSSPCKVSLDLRDCNLLDTVMPKHLGCFSWAASLDLSRNKFTTLPDNFFLLYNLEKLTMDYCNELRTLPKFPLSLRLLEMVDCPLLEMDYYQTDVRKIPLCISVWFSVATDIGYDGTPYKILQLNPRHQLIKYTFYDFDEGDIFAWGPTLGFEIPGWFNNRSINLLGKIQCCVDVDSEYWKMGLALFVAYQVHEQGNSNGSISGASNLAFPEFVWRFQAFDICQELPLVFHVPEVPFVVPNGFWAYIPAQLFKKNGRDLHSCQYLEISIETSNLNVEVKECGVRLVHKHNVLELFDVLASITPHGLELKSLEDFRFRLWAGVQKKSDEIW